LPRYTLPPGPSLLDPATLFSHPTADLWFEIGFGGGEHLAWQAREHRDIGFIGCEPFENGVASLLHHAEAAGLDNLRIEQGDARLVLARLPDASVGRLFVLFPDPWPKLRHHRRRIIGPQTLDLFARVLKDGAELRAATDDPPYAAWMLFHLRRHPAFAWTARGPRDWRERPADWPQTRYEAKARSEGRSSAYLTFRRLPRQSGFLSS